VTAGSRARSAAWRRRFCAARRLCPDRSRTDQYFALDRFVRETTYEALRGFQPIRDPDDETGFLNFLQAAKKSHAVCEPVERRGTLMLM
jgi:hypothetical protein